MKKQKPKYTVDNILSFLEGTIKYYWSKFNSLPEYKQEQITYRLYKCKDDCLVENACIKCGCPPKKKVFVNKSCNPDRFPDMMSKEEWEKFKENEKSIRD